MRLVKESTDHKNEMLTMFMRVIDMGEVHNRRSSTIDHLQTTSQLSPKRILSRMQARREIALGQVLHQRLIGMASFEKCLPDMVVCVDEAGGDDLVGTIDDFAAWRRRYVRCYL